MRALVINVSAPHYNLGAHKLADWLRIQGYEVTLHTPSLRRLADPGLFAFGYDLVALSVIFSWHAPVAREIALRVKGCAEVWCGGPGMFALAAWWRRQTGLEMTHGLDARFEHQRSPRGSYRMTFASRGCPVNCSFCIVPRLEGTGFTLDWDFQPAPILCDNNLSALPVAFLEHVLRQYQDANTPLRDANSGFEPRTFDEATYHRWKPILRGPWRFAFDELAEGSYVETMMHILRGEPASRKRVYVLVGNEPIASCYDRAMRVIGWSGEPFCQLLRPLNYLGGPLRTRFDWTEQLGKDFCRYFNRFVWRYVPLRDYRHRQAEPPPFATIAL